MRGLLILSLGVLTGCYSYVPVVGTSLGRGTTVKARLSAPADFRLTDMAVNNAVLLSGEVVSHGRDTLALSVFSLRAPTGFTFPAAGETLFVPNVRIAELERRRFAPVRSALVLGAAVAATTLVFSSFDVGGNSGGGGRPPTPQ